MHVIKCMNAIFLTPALILVAWLACCQQDIVDDRRIRSNHAMSQLHFTHASSESLDGPSCPSCLPSSKSSTPLPDDLSASNSTLGLI
jgi:hypothetical protein